MELTDNIKLKISEHSKKEYPNECCGIIVNNETIPCTNVSFEPEKSFMINPLELKKYNKSEIGAFYHSHQNNIDFSDGDIYFSEKLQLPCVLYGNNINKFNIYNPNGKFIRYENRPFFIGVLDCFSLFRDYYKQELNLEFEDIQHPARFDYRKWETKELYEKYGYISAIKDYFLSNGFIEADKKNIKKHDIIEIKFRHIPFPTHIGIYIGNKQILHHLYDYSLIESYSPALQRLTTNIFRHGSLI